MPVPVQRAERSRPDVDKYQRPRPPGHSAPNPGTGGRRGRRLRPARAVTRPQRAGPHSALRGGGREPGGSFAPPSVLGVLSLRGGSCLPLQSGRSSQPTAVVGKQAKEGEKRRPPSSSNLTHTPCRRSKLRRQSPQRAAPRAPPASWELEPPKAVGGETPARTPRPGAASPKPDPAARGTEEATAAGQSARSAGTRTRNAHPLDPSGIKVGPAETHPRRISRAP